MAGSSGSLRETYAAPTDAWAFIPASSSSSNSSTGNPTTSGTTWTRPASSRPHVFDLTPTPFDDFGSVMLDDVGGRDWGKLISDALAAGVLSYASTAVVMPFEVAKVLLQVQWIPKEEVADALDPPEELPGTTEEPVDEDTVSMGWGAGDNVVGANVWFLSKMSDTSSSSYFRDPSTLEPPIKFEPSSRTHVTDEEGYPIHRGLDSETRPSYIIPAGPSDGVWGMIRRIAGWKTEGYLSLWKGSYTSSSFVTLTNSGWCRSIDCHIFGRYGICSSARNPLVPLLFPDTSGPHSPTILTRDPHSPSSFAHHCSPSSVAFRPPPHKADMPACQRSFDFLTHLALPVHPSSTSHRS